MISRARVHARAREAGVVPRQRIFSGPDRNVVQGRLEPRFVPFWLRSGNMASPLLFAAPIGPASEIFLMISMHACALRESRFATSYDRRFLPLLRGSVMTSGGSL